MHEDTTLGPLEDFEEGVPVLRRADGKRYACVRQGSTLHVVDDRCPHEGYPLSQGTVRDGVLTCAFHNWKFELNSGACTFGGEPARRFPCRIKDGQAWIDPRIDPAAERRRIAASMEDGLRRGSTGSVVRDGTRLDQLGEPPRTALGIIARDAARRAPWGFEHGLAMLSDVAQWIDGGLVRPGEAFAAMAALVAEPLVHAPVRTAAPAQAGTGSQVRSALVEERRSDAEGIARHLAREGRFDELLRDGLLPWLARDLAGYGHGVIFALKAAELIAHFDDPEIAEELAASLVISHGWATIESALPGWGATHRGIRDAEATGTREPLLDPAPLLTSERSATGACLGWLRDGIAPRSILLAGARAAAIRVARFDDAWERRTDTPVTVLHVSHLLTFAEATLALTMDAEPGLAAAFCVQLGGFVGKLAAADGVPAKPTAGSSIAEALAARDLPAALGASADPSTYYGALAEHALHDAFVRPIFAAHAVKTTESARRLEALDPQGAPHYRAAAATVIVPRRPERFSAREADIASRFLATGRPPAGLY